MATDFDGLTHPFHDIEVEALSHPPGTHLIKILALDGRRFTYRLNATFGPAAIAYIKKVIDSGASLDLVIEPDGNGFRTEASPAPLKKHG